jgi:uncharacterized protein YcbX
VTGFVEWIMVAPVKALGLVARDEVQVTEGGVADNRRFHLIDDRGRMVNGKTVGTLVAVRPDYDAAANRLALALPDGSVVEGPVTLGETIGSQFYGRPRPVRPVLGPFSAALSEIAGKSVRLVRAQSGAVDRGREGSVSLVSTADGDGFDLRRFRMLFGIGGVPAHAEDGWIGKQVRIGEAVVEPLSETGRCLITSQDPDTGVPDMDMLEWIRANRPEGTGEPLPFGVHGRVIAPGVVRVGDPVSPPPAPSPSG